MNISLGSTSESISFIIAMYFYKVSGLSFDELGYFLTLVYPNSSDDKLSTSVAVCLGYIEDCSGISFYMSNGLEDGILISDSSLDY